MANELDILLAKDAIRQVMLDYCRGMDRMDDPLARRTFHPGARALYRGIFDGTGDEFCAWALEFHGPLLATTHEIQNCHIEIAPDGAAARSETYVFVNLLREENGRQILVSGHGRYLDKWSRRDGRWAIDDRHYITTFSYEREVTARLGPFRRDPTDPSYEVLDGGA